MKKAYTPPKYWYKVTGLFGSNGQPIYEYLTQAQADRTRALGYEVTRAPGYTPPTETEPENKQLNLFDEETK